MSTTDEEFDADDITRRMREQTATLLETGKQVTAYHLRLSDQENVETTTVFPPAFLHLTGASPEIIKSIREAWSDKKSVTDLETTMSVLGISPAVLEKLIFILWNQHFHPFHCEECLRREVAEATPDKSVQRYTIEEGKDNIDGASLRLKAHAREVITGIWSTDGAITRTVYPSIPEISIRPLYLVEAVAYARQLADRWELEATHKDGRELKEERRKRWIRLLRKILAGPPTVSKDEWARGKGVSRSTVYNYLKGQKIREDYLVLIESAISAEARMLGLT